MDQRQTSWVGATDRLGVIASAACFVHCLATPIILSFSAVYAHFLPSEEHTHRVLAILVTLIGAVALGAGYRKHKQKSILGLMAIGVALILAGAYLGSRLPSHAAEVAITLAGSCCMIVAHRLNHTFCGRCRSCASTETPTR
jgi:carbon starvation protein CstA